MPKEKILIVEDERVVAMDIQNRLKDLGYSVCGLASSGEDAVKKASELQPDLVLMDIVLKGKMDGIDAAGQIRERFNIPVVYLTAFSDEKTLQRARLTGPYGYILKPFEDSELRSNVEMALYKGGMDARIKHLNLVLSAIRSVNQLIVTEKDRDRLLEGSCENLVGTRGYRAAWTALFDERGQLITTAEAGVGEDFTPMRERLARGELPECCSKALEASSVVVVRDPATMCPGCPIAKKYCGAMVLAVRLEHAEGIHGVLIVALPEGLSEDEEEIDLIHEVANDVAFALHGIEVDEKRKRIEEARETLLAELERSNKDLEQFAYVASHDLQEPLRMVSSYTQLLGKRYKDRLDEDANEFIEYAVDGANRMQRLINDLLAYSRVSTRGAAIESADSHAALGEAITGLAAAIDENHAVISNDDLPTVRADKSQLVQMFQNLIGNAIKFRGDEPPRVHVSAVKEGHEWVFSVRDNGIGIATEHQERIFTIFQRLHVRGKYPGTGIGLAICKRVVTRHGGRIWVESEPAKGSTFYFTLRA